MNGRLLLPLLLPLIVCCNRPSDEPPGAPTGPDESATKATKMPDTPVTPASPSEEAALKAKAEAAIADSAKGLTEVVEKAEAMKATAKATEEIKAAGTAATIEAKSAAEDVSEEAKKAAESIDLDSVLDSALSLEKLQGMVGTLSSEKLTGLADKLLNALKSKEGIVAGLREQISKLGPTELGKAADLKKNLDAALGSFGDLKEKLKVITDKLTTSGVDVSKYTSFFSKQE